MKITKKLIEGVRVNTERAEKLREKKLEIMLEIKEDVKESDLVNFLIDTYVDKIRVNKAGELYVDPPKK